MASVPADPGLPDSADPFASPLSGMGFFNYAVVKISNIPYGTTKEEIVHFLGRDSQDDMIRENIDGTPIHIIMERSTSKTMDCYVEMKNHGAAFEQVQSHWDSLTGGSPRPPKLGQRQIIVDMATADELLKDMFPRAKCVRWALGQPFIMENDDPYSTGFTGYFTNEEMVGLVRHAEHPARSPFSMKCLQRTYECMISTLWKFPWAASSTYTIGDRNKLFVTFMKLLDVLVYKVGQGNVVMLSQQLLLDYLFAGLNCRGFGERQRGLIYARGGPIAAPIRVQAIHQYWPFDVVGKKIGQNDEEFCKTYLNLVEQGVWTLGPAELMPKYFITAPGRLPRGFKPPIRVTHFEFNQQSQSLPFSAAIDIELQLMRKLLKAGYKKVNGVFPGTNEESQRQEEEIKEEKEREKKRREEMQRDWDQKVSTTYLAATMARLKEQNEALKKEQDEAFKKKQDEALKKERNEEMKKDQEDSPPQSPKGTFAQRDIDAVDAHNTPIRRSSLTDSNPPPPRRASEPRPSTGTLGAGLDISPLRSASGSKAIPIRDPNTKMYRTPTKAAKKTSFVASDTIQEENESDEA